MGDGDQNPSSESTTACVLAPVRWLPTEVWMDIFKLLSMRTLLRVVQPCCRRFNTIVRKQINAVLEVRALERFL